MALKKLNTGSDCEVVAHIIATHGPHVWSHLQGCSHQQYWILRLILSRDYFGEKPLYYCLKMIFIFSSEAYICMGLDVLALG